MRPTPASAIASASGVRRGEYAHSTQWASAFIPVSALTRTGVDSVSSGSWMTAIGATVGPPAPALRRVCSSVIPKKGVSSAPE
jgi:hypothetical protein